MYSAPKKYLYIPNNALLKSGAFNYITQYFEMDLNVVRKFSSKD
ncbi:MAG: hypothetical protein ACFNTA_00830 [Campylobacter sp.]